MLFMGSTFKSNALKFGYGKKLLSSAQEVSKYIYIQRH